MTASRSIPILLALAWLPLTAAAAPPPTPAQFAHRATITVQGDGPHFHAPLPLLVYQGAAHADLADLRVFNAAGEAVPYAVTRPNASMRVSRIQHVPRGLFPLQGNVAAGSEGLRVEIRREADGRLVSIQGGDGAGVRQVTRGVVVDVGASPGLRLSRLDLELDAPTGLATQGVTGFHEIMVEGSDDLEAWRPLRQRARIVLLEHEGRTLEQNRVELSGEVPRYLRLIWTSAGPAPTIRGVRLWLTESMLLSAPLVWHGPITASRSDGDSAEYEVAGQIPLERLRVLMPQVNSLAEIAVQRREAPVPRRPSHPLGLRQVRDQRGDAPVWRDLGRQVVYRLQTQDGEVTQPELELDGRPAGALRLLAVGRGGGFGVAVPQIEIGFVPREIVFLARGSAPFRLAWGLATAEDAQLPLATLIPGYQAGREIPARSAAVDTTDAPAAAPLAQVRPTADAARTPFLWAVLVAAVLILGCMAAALLRQTRATGRKSGPGASSS